MNRDVKLEFWVFRVVVEYNAHRWRRVNGVAVPAHQMVTIRKRIARDEYVNTGTMILEPVGDAGFSEQQQALEAATARQAASPDDRFVVGLATDL